MSRSGPCRCEQFPIGPLGPIGDHETLVRLVHSPEHVRKNGDLKPSVFPPSHILKSGLSLVRVDMTNPLELADLGNANAAQKEGRSWAGYLAFEASLPRQIMINGDRAVCVWEDPVPARGGVPANDAHALLVANRELNEADALEIRSKLWWQRASGAVAVAR